MGRLGAATLRQKVDCNAWVHDQHHRERQLYTDKENAHVKDGVLYIEARRDEPTPDLPYSSARLTTRDAPHGRWRYGRVEVCAKLPPGKPGLWPAIWMMPSRSVYGKWPLSGEIDLMENVGWEPGVVRASIHTAKNHRRWGNHNRRVSGVLRGYDQFLNLVLEDATEDGSDGAKTPIGMVVLRGNGIIQLQSLERLS